MSARRTLPGVVYVRYHAAARELAGCAHDTFELDAPTTTLESLRAKLAARHERLGPYMQRMRVALNGELALDTCEVRDGDEVDLLPPVAGGSGDARHGHGGHVAICEEPLSVDECMRAVMHPGAGGVVVFTGVVRDHAEGQAVARLDYEAHPELAHKEMHRIVRELADEIPEARVAVTHRVGQLEVGDLAVVVAASAPHRGEAFQACRAAIDRIKETVPIWKKEWAPDGTAHWVNFC